MSRVSTYLNFAGNTEEAFTFYKNVFGTEFEGTIDRMGDVPQPEGQPELTASDKNLVMHVMLPILGGHYLMGTDAIESMGFKMVHGNNVHINLEPDTLEETERVYNALSEGGAIEMKLQKMFWGDHFASFTDKFGINWMINCGEQR